MGVRQQTAVDIIDDYAPAVQRADVLQGALKPDSPGPVLEVARDDPLDPRSPDVLDVLIQTLRLPVRYAAQV